MVQLPSKFYFWQLAVWFMVQILRPSVCASLQTLGTKKRYCRNVCEYWPNDTVGNIECWRLAELLWHDFLQILRVSWWVAVMAILWCDDKTSRSEVTVWMSLDRAGMSPHQHRCWQARCVVTTGAPQTPSIGKHQYIGTDRKFGSVI